jgi:hypothetical protein
VIFIHRRGTVTAFFRFGSGLLRNDSALLAPNQVPVAVKMKKMNLCFTLSTATSLALPVFIQIITYLPKINKIHKKDMRKFPLSVMAKSGYKILFLAQH